MAFRLETGERLGAGVRRIVGEELRNAVDQLEGRGDPARDAAVHSARKSLKKARSALRLVRFDVGDEVRSAENEVLGDAGRSLSGVRDADVLLKTLERLRTRDDVDLPEPAVAALRTALERRRDELVASAHDGAAADAARSLREAARRVETWPLDDRARRALRDGLLRIYARGRTAMGAALADGVEDEAWHDWRKRVKDLWYALRILEPVAPALLGGMVEEADRLSDLLGDHNDLAVLDVAIGEHADALGPGDAEALRAAVRGRRDELRAAAAAPGARLYAESPKAFVARVRRYWKVRTGISTP